MKKLLLTVIIAVIAIPAFSQFNVYHPFPDSNAYWGEENEFSTGGPLTVNDFGYKLLGDTIIKSRTYHKVYKVGGMSNSGAVTPYSVFYGAIREDSMKHVYACCVSGSFNKDDTLYYDFNLKVGDTLNQANSAPQGFLGPEKNYVSKIDSVLIDGNYRKRFTISTNANNSLQVVTQMIEGIGSLEGLLEPIEIMEGKSSVLCFRQNGFVEYATSGYFTHDTCIVYGPLDVNTITNKIPSFSIYPNPANTAVALSFQLQNKNSVLSLYNSMGQLVKTQVINSNDKSITEDVSILPNGIYYYTLSIDGVIEATNKLAIIK